MCLLVCLSVYLHNISKTDAASITKLDVAMVHRKSWKPFILGQKSTIKGTKAMLAWFFALF